MEKPLYYRTRIMDLDAPDIVAMCDELLFAADYSPKVSYDYQLWKWLSWFFQEVHPSTLTSRHFLPGSPLTTRISKMSGTSLYVFCTELAEARHLGFDMYADGNLLTFLKAVYRKDYSKGTRR